MAIFSCDTFCVFQNINIAISGVIWENLFNVLYTNSFKTIKEVYLMAGIKFFNEHPEWAPVILRVFFGVAFIVAALDKILGMEMAKGMFSQLFGGAGPALLYLAIAIELLGGLALLFNWHASWAALILAVFILVSFVTTFKLGAAPHFVGTLR